VPVLRQPSYGHGVGCRWFWAWALFGLAAAFGFLVAGVLVAAPAALVGSLMTARPTVRRSAFGFVSGVGLLSLYVAWLQRAGPGTISGSVARRAGAINP
jgi:hypothetical protein